MHACGNCKRMHLHNALAGVGDVLLYVARGRESSSRIHRIHANLASAPWQMYLWRHSRVRDKGTVLNEESKASPICIHQQDV
jgi:hypothetical protein